MSVSYQIGVLRFFEEDSIIFETRAEQETRITPETISIRWSVPPEAHARVCELFEAKTNYNFFEGRE